MAIGAHIGDENGIAQKVTKLYVGDENGIAQEVVKAYIGDENGIAQLCYIKAKAQVTLTGMSDQHYCVIGGTTYNSGDYALELEIGTPIYIHFLETSGMNTQVYINSDQLADAVQNCYPVRYVVTGDVSVACLSTASALMTSKKAFITEAEPKSGCFVLRTTWSTGEIDNEVFCFRGGMTWAQFVSSMYNDGRFLLNDSGVVCDTNTTNHVLIPRDDESTSGYAVKATDKIYHRQVYI